MSQLDTRQTEIVLGSSVPRHLLNVLHIPGYSCETVEEGSSISSESAGEEMDPGNTAAPEQVAGSSLNSGHERPQTDGAAAADPSSRPKMATGNLERMNQAVRNISAEEDEYNDMIMMSTSRVRWEDFLEAAPQSIILLGQLMLLARAKDFKLPARASKDFELSVSASKDSKLPPNASKDFKLPASASKEFTHSESFSSCLVQISNRGWEAFNEAHTSMHQIEISSATVQTHVKFAVRIISTGSPEDIQDLLPRSLKSIETIANDCLTLSDATETKFVNVMGLIGNVLEACTEAKGQYEDDLRKAKAALRIAEESKVHAAQQNEKSEKQLADIEKQLDEATEQYKQALNAMPGAGKLIGVTCLESITGSLGSALNILAGGVAMFINPVLGAVSYAASAVSRHSKSADDGLPGPDCVEQSVRESPHGIDKVYIHAEKLNDLCTNLSAFVKNPDDIDWKEEDDQLAYYVQFARTLHETISKEVESGTRIHALHLCQQAISLSENLTELRNTLDVLDGDDRKKRMKENVQIAKGMEKSSKKFLAKSIAYSGSIHSKTKTPHLSKFTPYKSSCARDAIVDTWRFNLSVAEAQLKNAQRRADETYLHRNETSKPLNEAILEISRCDLEKINFDEIRDTLIKGMYALAEVREQWGKLVRFFQAISNLIKCILNKSLKEFKESVETGKKRHEDHIKLSDCLLDMIYMQAFTASKVAHVVHHIASMYMEVSNTAIMDKLASLPKLLVLESSMSGNVTETSEEIIQSNMAELMSDCEQTQKVIREMVEKKQAEFHSAISGRINHIKCELGAVLPVDTENYEIASESISSVEQELQEDMSAQAPI